MPATPKATDTAVEADLATPDESLSSQAHFSTYAEDDDPELADKNPPDGPHVVQTLGKPSEGPVTAPTGS